MPGKPRLPTPRRGSRPPTRRPPGSATRCWRDFTITWPTTWTTAPGGRGRPLPVPDAALDLSAAMHRNPALRVRLAGGLFDLAAPFAAAEFDIGHLHLVPALA